MPKISFSEEYDVMVCGGGVAGIAAALSAVRNGASCVLVEKQCMLGGLGTAGLVTIYLPLCDGMGNQMIFGIGEELLRLSIKHGHEARYPAAWLEGGTKEERAKKRFEVRYNAQMFAILAEQLLLSEGVKIMYDTMVTDTNVKDGKITSVTVHNRQGQGEVGVKSVVDCTGDAVVCHLAGENCEMNDKNYFAAWYYHSTDAGYDLKPIAINYNNPPEGEPTYDGLCYKDVNEMIIRGHREVLDDVLRRRTGEHETMPVTIPTMPSFRMTRRLAGAYTLDESEERCEFSDTIGKTGDWRKRGPVFSIPYRCLHGEKISNLLAAGRCISVTKSMWDITRVIPTCALTGEAAGAAAALTAECGSVTGFDVGKLQKRLPINGSNVL